MKKEPLFFTDKTEIGAKHVPIDNTKFRTGGIALLAPNGKPSNLSPKLYEIVRTPEFKAWFGDWENDPENASKVVDENGEPLIMYHGSLFEFNVFDKEYWGYNTFSDIKGFFFTNGKEEAQAYMEENVIFGGTGNKKGFLKECFLNLKDPIIETIWDEDEPSLYIDNQIHLVKYNKGNGLIVKNQDKNWITAVVFEPNQIKLADGTNTTFDPNNDDIRFDKGGQVNPNSFMKWYIGWYKGISDKMVITITLPNAIAPFKEKNVVILDVFEKKDQNIDATPYLKKIVEKADEYGVVIYLEPTPRHKYFQDNLEKKNKITKQYLIDYYQKFGFELTPNKQFMKRIPHFAGGGGIDINEPFNVNGKTLAERVRILVKQLYPDYKWSITSSYNKLDVYLLEADFEPFTDFWRQEYPDRDKYYNVTSWDFNEYNREYKAQITDRAMEVFKPIREYIDKVTINYNAGDPYSDYPNYNVYENTYIGKWDKPYVQVEPKAGKKPKAPSSPKTVAPTVKDLLFKEGDILTYSLEKLNKMERSEILENQQKYFEVVKVSEANTVLNEYNKFDEKTEITVPTGLITSYFIKTRKPKFKVNEWVKVITESALPIRIVKIRFCSQPEFSFFKSLYGEEAKEKRFSTASQNWLYTLENNDTHVELNLQELDSPEPKFKVGDIITYRSTQDKKYTVIEFIEFDNEIQENIYRIESLSDKTKGKAKESMMALVEPTTSSDNPFMIQNIVSKTQWSDGLKQSMITDFVNSGYEDVTSLIGEDESITSYNIRKKVDGFASGKNTALQANYLAEIIHTLIKERKPTPSEPTPETDSFLEYLKANNEKATLIPRELEAMNALTLFVQSAKDIENLDADRYANLTVNMVAKLSENK